jgi:hypothetical protein
VELEVLVVQVEALPVQVAVVQVDIVVPVETAPPVQEMPGQEVVQVVEEQLQQVVALAAVVRMYMVRVVMVPVE